MTSSLNSSLSDIPQWTFTIRNSLLDVSHETNDNKYTKTINLLSCRSHRLLQALFRKRETRAGVPNPIVHLQLPIILSKYKSTLSRAKPQSFFIPSWTGIQAQKWWQSGVGALLISKPSYLIASIYSSSLFLSMIMMIRGLWEKPIRVSESNPRRLLYGSLQ